MTYRPAGHEVVARFVAGSIGIIMRRDGVTETEAAQIAEAEFFEWNAEYVGGIRDRERRRIHLALEGRKIKLKRRADMWGRGFNHALTDAQDTINELEAENAKLRQGLSTRKPTH